jgi:D-alanine-D-alanine ligase
MKIRVAVLFGGRSAEHEISLQSARNVIKALDKERYDVTLIAIDREGAWYLNEESEPILNFENPRLIALNKIGDPVSIIPSHKSGVLISQHNSRNLPSIDVIFPVLHGPFGEDGSIQGLAKLANVACVGSDILGSAIGMDKDVSKRLLRDAGIPVAKHIALRRPDLSSETPGDIAKKLGFPVYVKPANMGSSVGVVRVINALDLPAAMDHAFQYDVKILIEEEIVGRELECSVLGNDKPVASVVGEILGEESFYSYEKKYIDEDGVKLKIPAELESSMEARIQATSIAAFRALEVRGMARVDMFLSNDNCIYVNEINTIPGFTEISMYPKLWNASGLSPTELTTQLIDLALSEHRQKASLKLTGR